MESEAKVLMAIWKEKRAFRIEKHKIRKWNYTSSPIKERMPHSELVLQVLFLLYISSLLLALGISSIDTFNLNTGFYQSYLPKSMFSMPPSCLQDKKQTIHSQKAASDTTLNYPSSHPCNLFSSYTGFPTFPRIHCMFLQLPVFA